MSDDFGPGAVVMAVYRPDEKLFARQIVSLRAQTVTDWRCLVGIDGADPETAELARRLVADDSRFEVVEYQVNVGVYRHFERLLNWVPEDVAWVSLADQDDYWYPGKFERLLPLLTREGVTAVSGQARLVSADGAILGRTCRRPGSVREVLLRNEVSGALTLFRRELFHFSLPFPEATRIAIHDHWLGVCAAAIGEVAVLDEPVQDYVQHAGNVIGERGERAASSGEAVGAFWDRWARKALFAVREQWAWRVSMALQARDNLGDMPPGVVLQDVSGGRLSLEIMRAVIFLHRSGGSDMRKSLGIVTAAALWPVLGRRRLGERVSSADNPPSEPGLEKVGIVVPVFEPSQDVVENVRAMSAQAPVVCVDDGSSETASATLDNIAKLDDVTLIRSRTNRGIAAALNTGVGWWLDRDVDVVVTFDQDTRPAADHVARLLAALGEPGMDFVGIIGPGAVDGIPAAGFVDGAPVVDVPTLIQSGMAIRTLAFVRAGTFDETLFIDGVDTDFCLRVSRAGLRVTVLQGLDMPHGLGGHTGSPRRYRVGPFRPIASHHSPFRRYYMNRNTVVLLRRHGGSNLRWAFLHLRRMAGSNVLSWTVEPDRWSNVVATLRGIVAGFRVAPRE